MYIFLLFKDPLSVIFVFHPFKMIFKENYFYRLLRLCSKVCSKKKIRSNEIEFKKLQSISRRLLTFFHFYIFFFKRKYFYMFKPLRWSFSKTNVNCIHTTQNTLNILYTLNNLNTLNTLKTI